MILKFLTLLSFLTAAAKPRHHFARSYRRNFTDIFEQPPYNINHYVSTLNLQTCAFVAIGLKYFAIFVEDYVTQNLDLEPRKKYFLGICHYDTLKEWKFCSPELYKVNTHKCRLKLSGKRYQQRVQRRFCDLQVMVGNRECMCIPTLFGDTMHKVVGFPTCYVPLLPASLCKYNVCGLARCNASTEENAIHTVHCDPECRGRRPFCEYPVGSRTLSVPEITSSWTEWKEVASGMIGGSRMMKTYTSECQNNVTKGGGIDCLGPGTQCCTSSANVANCTCRTVMENGRLITERIVYYYSARNTSPEAKFIQNITSLLTMGNNILSPPRLPPAQPPKWGLRNKRGSDAYETDDDDDDETDNIDDDIVLEENENNEPIISTTEELEKDEAKQELQKEAVALVKDKKVFNDTEAEVKAQVSKGYNFLENKIIGILTTTYFRRKYVYYVELCFYVIILKIVIQNLQ